MGWEVVVLGVYGVMLCGAVTMADNRDVQGNKKRDNGETNQ